MDKTNLTGFTLEELQLFSEQIGEKEFRGRQIFSWIYERKATDFAEMTDLSKNLRNRFRTIAEIGQLQLSVKKRSPISGTIKYLFRLKDATFIESVYIPEVKRHTLCISSQAGCALQCTFCATGQLGFRRNLSAGEIVDQVIFVERDIGQQITNVVLMGMGEPFLNYDAVMKACGLIKHEDGLAIGFRHIVISTVGIVPAVYRYADEGHLYRLAISLHSAIESKRQGLMPVAKKYPLGSLMDAVRHYFKKTHRRPTIEYVLIADVNDGESDARALKTLLKDMPCKVNIIPYNPVVSRYQSPGPERVHRFTRWLYPLRAPVSVRWSKGADIDAACGQLAYKHTATG